MQFTEQGQPTSGQALARRYLIDCVTANKSPVAQKAPSMRFLAPQRLQYDFELLRLERCVGQPSNLRRALRYESPEEELPRGSLDTTRT